MRKPRSFTLGQKGKPHFYHIVSRTTGKQRLFGEQEKETFQQILLKQIKFSGVRLIAWCFMGNHFHLLVEVPDKESTLARWTEAMVLDQLQFFRDELSTRLLLSELATCRNNSDTAGITAIANRIRARLFDLSMFMKELKQRMTIAYNLKHQRTGTLWESRFKSVLLEGGDAVKLVAAYIDLNPVRAGITADPKDYRWCSYAAAVAGMDLARTGLCIAVTGSEQPASWQPNSAIYRKLLFGIGDSSTDSKSSSRAGFTAAQAEAVWAAGGKLTTAEALRCRIRYFTDGAVIGSQQFIEEFFNNRRNHFGKNRKSGARTMRGAHWGGLRTLRSLRISPLTTSTPPSIEPD